MVQEVFSSHSFNFLTLVLGSHSENRLKRAICYLLCIIVSWFQFFFAYNKQFTNNEFLAKTRRFKMRYFSVAINKVLFVQNLNFHKNECFLCAI